ncbi:MAG: alpha-glucosidase [Acidobacteria bacterium]|nr:alpha-glucosidase [Acidobacteriota bacterium]
MTSQKKGSSVRPRLRWEKLLATLALALLLPAPAAAQKKPAALDREGHPWWRHAVFYEIYPRSFADSNNDGIGDLKGITSHLNYLKSLGVDAIWITPCFPSPQVDFGYDVSNYTDIEPMYGTLADFDGMVARGRKDHIRVVLDFVMNHTSDRHPWFLQSKSSRSSEYRDWYIWRDGKPPDVSQPPMPPLDPNAPGGEQPPNNWTSIFGGTAWKYDPTTQQWYYHFFDPAQPDLNWRNPKVHDAMFRAARFWFERGVAGFRLDAVDTLFEDPDLRDNPPLPNVILRDAAGNPLPNAVPGKDAYGMPLQRRIYNDNLPENHVVLQQLRQLADQYGAVLIGETWTENIAQLREYYGESKAEIQLPMDFLFANVNRLSAPEFRRQVALVESAGGWPVYLFSNHDITRAYNRYGGPHPTDQVAKLLAGLLLTLRGTPILYYGEELGMENRDPVSREEVQDPIGVRGWPLEKGRDGERTPMQWTSGPNAGFTSGKPWLPIAANYQTHNVESESRDPNSVLNFYRAAIRLRHRNMALVEGNYVALNERDPNVMAYLRQYRGHALLVALNMSPQAQTVSLDLSGQGYGVKARLHALLTSNAARDQKPASMKLEPYGVFIGELKK